MKLLLVDDHPVFRSGVASLVNTVFHSPVVIQAAESSDAVTLWAGHQDTDLALVDLALPGTMGGLGLVRFLRQQSPALPIIVMSGHESTEAAAAASKAGATVFLPKSASTQVLLDTIARLVGARALAAAEAPGVDPPIGGVLDLTARQLEVLELMCRGSTNREICEKLGLAEQTIKGHATAIFRALGVSSRTQAVVTANRMGMFSLPPPKSDPG